MEATGRGVLAGAFLGGLVVLSVNAALSTDDSGLRSQPLAWSPFVVSVTTAAGMGATIVTRLLAVLAPRRKPQR